MVTVMSHWVFSLLKVLVTGPSRNNSISVPDASGVLVVQAVAPLYVNQQGVVSLDQSEIVQVGELVAGSIGRNFGE